MKNATFETQLQSSHTFLVPEFIATGFINNGQKRVKVKVSFQKKIIEYHAAIQKYHGLYHITLNAANQKKLTISPIDHFTVELLEDTSKYGVEMPEELEAVLQSDFHASEIFESLTDGKKRSIIYYILKIKNSQTRIDRSIRITENLKRGIRDHRELIKPI